MHLSTNAHASRLVHVTKAHDVSQEHYGSLSYRSGGLRSHASKPIHVAEVHHLSEKETCELFPHGIDVLSILPQVTEAVFARISINSRQTLLVVRQRGRTVLEAPLPDMSLAIKGVGDAT